MVVHKCGDYPARSALVNCGDENGMCELEGEGERSPSQKGE